MVIGLKRIKTPIVAVNFKAYYPYSFGENSKRIAEDAKRVWKETGVQIILIPPATELYRIKEVVKNTDILVYAQHADPIEPGARTGFLPLEGLVETGIDGILLNHSEHRLKLADIFFLIKKARKLGLHTLVCADVPENAAAVAVLEPDIIAVEPPELIGTGIPVSKAKPEVITRSVELVRRVNENVLLLTGAGISKGEDVEIAVKLGTVGVLVASAIVKAKNPYEVIKSMAVHALKGLQ